MRPRSAWLLVFVALVSSGTLACSAAGAKRCDELITAQELQSLGRNDTLTKVEDTRGSSICMWEPAPEKGSGFVLTLQTAEWFEYEDASGPKDSFDRKRHGYDAVVGTDPVPELGLEARITRHDRVPTVMIRRGADVVYLMCTDCSRDQTLSLAKLAAAQ